MGEWLLITFGVGILITVVLIVGTRIFVVNPQLKEEEERKQQRKKELEERKKWIEEHHDEIQGKTMLYLEERNRVIETYLPDGKYERAEYNGHQDDEWLHYDIFYNGKSVVFIENFPSDKLGKIGPDLWNQTTEEILNYKPHLLDKVNAITLLKEDIIYFRKTGDIQYTTEISGGKVTGGGSSIGGAVVGGLLAGDAGAIIGSRKKIESEGITTNVVEHDSRKVLLKTKTQEVEFDLDMYDILMRFIPEKEYTYIMATKSGKEEQKKSTVDQLKDAKEMLDAGMITEDEFAAIKAELLPAKSK